MTPFFIADLHLGHDNICKFLREDGTKLRPWDNVREMDEALIDNFNSEVRDGDVIYFLGDIAMNEKGIASLKRFRGHKELILGNHDNLKFTELFNIFRRITSQKKKHELMMTHVPIHAGSFNQFRANIHGHLHHRKVLTPEGSVDPRYLCVSVEHTNYRPISLDEVLVRLRGIQ